jgi:hypothetical protein
MKTPEYVILLALDPSDLSSLVNARLRDGWEVTGGLALAEVHDQQAREDSPPAAPEIQWAQAMIRKGEFTNDPEEATGTPATP